MKLSINLSIDLGNTNEAMFYGLLMKEVGKYNIPITLGQPTETTAKAVVAPKQSKPTTTAKAVAPKPTAKASAKADEPNGKYTVKNDAEFILVLDKDGYITLTTGGKKFGDTAWRLASGLLRKQNCVTPGPKDYRYFVAGKGGKISKASTKKVFEEFGGKILITAKQCNDAIAERFNKRA